MYVGHVSLQSPLGRGDNVGTTGTSISTYYLVARAIAPLSQDLAQNLAPAEEVDFAAGTAAWRLVWWANIWLQVHARLSTALFGLGYGYPVGDLNPDIDPDAFIQTPHSVVFYALAFSGWAGVVLFSLLQIEIARLLWRSYQLNGQLFGLICWAALAGDGGFRTLLRSALWRHSILLAGGRGDYACASAASARASEGAATTAARGPASSASLKERECFLCEPM